jgi:hypothetical protein
MEKQTDLSSYSVTGGVTLITNRMADTPACSATNSSGGSRSSPVLAPDSANCSIMSSGSSGSSGSSNNNNGRTERTVLSIRTTAASLLNPNSNTDASGDDDDVFNISVHELPKRVADDVSKYTLTIPTNMEDGSREDTCSLKAIVVMLKSRQDLVCMGAEIEDEKDRLLEVYLQIAKIVVKELGR